MLADLFNKRKMLAPNHYSPEVSDTMLYSFFIIGAVVCAMASDLFGSPHNLVIISPNRKSVQQEFIPRFEEYYKKKYSTEVKVAWLDQGGASDDHRFIVSRFEKNPQSIGIDIFWGGGEQPHYDLDSRNLLTPYLLPDYLRIEIPQNIVNIPLYNLKETWHASAISSFGIFFNKKANKLLKIPNPQSWEDLASPLYYKNVSIADPRRSSSNVTILLIILRAYGWERGWQILTGIAANTKKFLHSSTDPIRAVVSGETTCGLTVGYYARAKILELGGANLGFVMPQGKTILNADPISILKGAPNLEVAKRFVEFLLQADMQKILVLPKGHKDGPLHATLGRMAVNRKTYEDLKSIYAVEDNPFELDGPTFRFDMEEATRLQGVFMDLYAATLIDSHQSLRKAWKAIIRRGMKEEEWKQLSVPPITEEELTDLAKRWDDQTLRNQKINSWLATSNAKFQKFSK